MHLQIEIVECEGGIHTKESTELVDLVGKDLVLPYFLGVILEREKIWF